MKVRYYKLLALLRKRGIRIESLRRRVGLFPSAIARIESNRMLDPYSLFLLCRYFECTVDDIMEYFHEEEQDTFYSSTVLKKYPYTPTPMIPKEFKTP